MAVDKNRIAYLQKGLRKSFWQLNEDFQLIEPNDKVMVCLSGGKDSYTMLDILLQVRDSGVIPFSIVAVNLDQKQPGFPEHILPEYLSKLDVEYHIIEKDTYSVVMDKTPEGKTMCSICSRLRRGTLYGFAEEHNVTKIALGHHRDDVLETFFLNLFFSGKMETMPSKYTTDDKKHIVIRPMAYIKEADIISYANERNFPIIPCNLCGSKENMQRQIIKKMIQDWDNEYPNRSSIIFNALKNISPSHLYDKSIFDFTQVSSSSLKELIDA